MQTDTSSNAPQRIHSDTRKSQTEEGDYIYPYSQGKDSQNQKYTFMSIKHLWIL